jgi:hypothetical protein
MSSVHLSSESAFKTHYKNQRKDKKWPSDLESYKRCIDALRSIDNMHRISDALMKHRAYWLARKEELEVIYPVLKKIFPFI